MRSLEAGLVDHSKAKTWARMRMEVNYLRSSNLYERPEIDVLTLDDMQMAFQLYLMAAVIAVTAAVVEYIYFKCYHTKNRSAETMGALPVPHQNMELR